MTAIYLIGLGGNRRSRFGRPEETLLHVIDRLPFLLSPASGTGEMPTGFGSTRTAEAPAEIITCSQIVTSRPLGPGLRRFANAVALVKCALEPPALLARLKAIELDYGRRRGRRWGDRVLDLDIIGWSGGLWASPGLSIPHPAFATRDFVLGPLAEIAGDWRDPLSGRTARQLRARLDRKRPRA